MRLNQSVALCVWERHGYAGMPKKKKGGKGKGKGKGKKKAASDEPEAPPQPGPPCALLSFKLANSPWDHLDWEELADVHATTLFLLLDRIVERHGGAVCRDDLCLFLREHTPEAMVPPERMAKGATLAQFGIVGARANTDDAEERVEIIYDFGPPPAAGGGAQKGDPLLLSNPSEVRVRSGVFSPTDERVRARSVSEGPPPSPSRLAYRPASSLSFN